MSFLISSCALYDAKLDLVFLLEYFSYHSLLSFYYDDQGYMSVHILEAELRVVF